MSSRVILAIAKKEVLQLLRDRGLLPLLLVAPLVQLVVFGYIIGADVKNLRVGVVVDPGSPTAERMLQAIDAQPYFRLGGRYGSAARLTEALASGEVDCGLVFAQGFESDLAARRAPEVLVLVDGTDPNVGRVAFNYLVATLRDAAVRGMKAALPPAYLKSSPTIELRARVVYNPELRNVNFMIPGLVGLIMTYISMILTSTAIVRERERGTLEQLIVSPLTRTELLLGKMLPFTLLALFDALVVTGLAVAWFRVPFEGDIPLFVLAAFLYLFASLGMGILASTVSKTQQQAIVTSIFMLIPTFLLTGFIFPLRNIPPSLRWISYLLPFTYFVELLRGLFLKGTGLAVLASPMGAVVVLGSLIFGVSLARFRKRLEG